MFSGTGARWAGVLHIQYAPSPVLITEPLRLSTSSDLGEQWLLWRYGILSPTRTLIIEALRLLSENFLLVRLHTTFSGLTRVATWAIGSDSSPWVIDVEMSGTDRKLMFSSAGWDWWFVLTVGDGNELLASECSNKSLINFSFWAVSEFIRFPPFDDGCGLVT